MTVYTRRRTSVVWTVPWWLLPLWLPFWLIGAAIWLTLAALWLVLVLSWKAAKWVCATLKIPREVDTREERSKP